MRSRPLPAAAPKPMAPTPSLVGPGFVLEQRQNSVRPVRHVVELLLVANRHEACSQSVELLPVQVVGRGRVRLPGVRLYPPDAGKADESFAATGRPRELVEQLVNARAALGCQRCDRLRQVLAVVISRRRSSP